MKRASIVMLVLCPSLMGCLSQSDFQNTRVVSGYQPALVVQRGDLDKSCQQISAEIDDLEGKILTTNAAINEQMNAGQYFDGMSTLTGTGASFGGESRARASGYAGLRQSFVDRATALTDIYNQKGC